VQAQVLARVRAGNPMSFGEIADALDVPLDVIVGGFAHSANKAGLLDGVSAMTDKYLTTDQASKEMDFNDHRRYRPIR
jgi:hypothetical protein